MDAGRKVAGPVTTPLWRASRPLLLASTSPTRRALLSAAGIPLDIEAPGLDERDAQARMGAIPPGALAQALAEAKARSVASRHPGRLVLGADQVLHCEGRAFAKPRDRAEARRHVTWLAGRTHRLHSGFALLRDEQVLAAGTVAADLEMRPLGLEAIAAYLDAAGEAALGSVGCYQVEGPGIHLFSRIAGEHSVILGLPMLAVLEALRAAGCLAV